jgi:L,D-peptidoglycan transpeptidase YkuD (ErfK/YbiS/YcfS/YnhG family)
MAEWTLTLAEDKTAWLIGGERPLRAAIGRHGIRTHKREGDGATPVGRFGIRGLLYRPDRLAAPVSAWTAHPLHPDDGWCDAPDHPLYNQPVRLPFAASHERMWRDDTVYDIVLPLGYNDDPIIPGAGSAIFLHLAKPDYEPTAGCIALSFADLTDFLACAALNDALIVPAAFATPSCHHP